MDRMQVTRKLKVLLLASTLTLAILPHAFSDDFDREVEPISNSGGVSISLEETPSANIGERSAALNRRHAKAIIVLTLFGARVPLNGEAAGRLQLPRSAQCQSLAYARSESNKMVC